MKLAVPSVIIKVKFPGSMPVSMLISTVTIIPSVTVTAVSLNETVTSAKEYCQSIH